MKILKFLFAFVVFMFIQTSGFSQNYKPLNVTLKSTAQELDFSKINLLMKVKDYSPTTYGFVIYYRNQRNTFVVEFKDDQFTKPIYAQRAAQMVIEKLKANQSILISGTDLDYIFSN